MYKPLILEEVLQRDLLKEAGAHLMPDIKKKRVTELLDLKGKKAVVTGAGGAGLGQACAHRLAGLGADVALVDINLDGARRNAEEVTKLWGTRAFPVHGDVCEWDDVHRFMRESHDKLGGIDILVNDAVAMNIGVFEKLTREQIDYTVRGVVLNVAYCCRAVLDYMIPQRSGRIINVSSAGGVSCQRGISMYSAGKAAVIHFTRLLAHEVAHYGIYVLGVIPGTMLHTGLQKSLAHPADIYPYPLTSLLEGFERIDLGRVSAAEEVANMVAFLASDAASYMSGESVNMAGGPM